MKSSIYEVRLAKRALADLRATFQAIRVEHSPVADDWFRGLELAIFSLEREPHRTQSTPERPGLKQLLYGIKPHRYRILYSIDEASRIVNVAQVRHWARSPLPLKD